MKDIKKAADKAFSYGEKILVEEFIRGRELRERGRIELAKGRFAFGLGRATKRLSFVKAGASILGSISFGGGGGGVGGFSTGPTGGVQGPVIPR